MTDNRTNPADKRNLLLLVPNLGLGGQERVAVNTSYVLGDTYNITMAVFTLQGSVYHAACPIIDLNIPSSRSRLKKIYNVLRRVRALKQLKRELNIDATISFGTTANIANSLSKVADRIIISIRGYAELASSFQGKLIDKIVYRRADIIACVAEKMARDLMETFHIPENKVVTLYNPYDCDKIVELAKLPVTIEIKHPAIVTMGRLEKVKGFRHLIRAMEMVRQEVSEAQLIIIGEGEERQELEYLTANLGLSQHVIFAGFQSDPHSYLAKCDLYVLSSINEGFPNALVEAMACGLPSIATDCNSGPREIFTEDYLGVVSSGIEYCDYGILIPPFESDISNQPELERLLSKAIIALLKDKSLRIEYSHRSQQRARFFSYEAYKNKIIKVIDEV